MALDRVEGDRLRERVDQTRVVELGEARQGFVGMRVRRRATDEFVEQSEDRSACCCEPRYVGFRLGEWIVEEFDACGSIQSISLPGMLGDDPEASFADEQNLKGCRRVELRNG